MAPRSEMRKDSLIHRASYVIIVNSKKEILIQQRSNNKDLYPGYYDPTTGGVVRAGESFEDNAVRELEEELGVTDVNLMLLFDHYFNDERIKVWGRVFLAEYDGEVSFNDGEVVSVMHLPISGLNNFFNENLMMPDGEEIVKRFLEEFDLNEL